MLNVDEFRALEVGDVIEADSFFRGLSDEPLKLEVVDVREAGDVKEFRGSVFGIVAGHFICAAAGDGLVWSEAPL